MRGPGYQLLSRIDNYTMRVLPASPSPIDFWRSHPPRSLLFVPADRASRFLPNADASAADGLIFDLEDAVAEGNKEVARGQLLELLERGPKPQHPFFVRVNSAPADRLERDIAAAVRLQASGVILPKTKHVSDIRQTVALLQRAESQQSAEPLAVLALLESPEAILNAQAIASAHPRVVGVGFGAEDLAADMGIRRTRGGVELLFARSQVVLAAAAAGCWALDPPPMDVHDESVARRESRQARRLGFVGKFVIHPRQVSVVNAAFAPDQGEIAWAQRVVDALQAAHETGGGTATVDGRLADEPTLRLARRILARASLQS
jgi:citrate lyase subunit beta/citryl-CoA lyase